MPLEKFLLGAFTTALREDEILESFEVPKLSRAGRYGYYKFCRKTGEYAEASAAAVFDPETQVARIYFGRGSSRTCRAFRPRPAGCPRGTIRLFPEEAVSAAIAEVANDLDPIERRMLTTAVARALQQVFAS